MFPIMDRESFIKEVMEWNICQGEEYANFIADAYFNGWIFQDDAKPYFSKENHTMDTVFYAVCDSKVGGNQYGWVNSKGKMIYCQWANHEAIVEMFLGGPVHEIERTHARISYHTKSVKEAMEYVDENYKTMAMAERVSEQLIAEIERRKNFGRN